MMDIIIAVVVSLGIVVFLFFTIFGILFLDERIKKLEEDK